jgi:hypothetical protein
MLFLNLLASFWTIFSSQEAFLIQLLLQVVSFKISRFSPLPLLALFKNQIRRQYHTQGLQIITLVFHLAH